MKNEQTWIHHESILDNRDWIDHPPGKEEQVGQRHGEENDIAQQQGNVVSVVWEERMRHHNPKSSVLKSVLSISFPRRMLPASFCPFLCEYSPL